MIFINVFIHLLAATNLPTVDQPLSFGAALKKIYFNVDANVAMLTTEAFRKIPAIHYFEFGHCQSSLEASRKFNDPEAVICSNSFSFTTDPFERGKIDSGSIELHVWQSKEKKETTDLIWAVYFHSRKAASEYFRQVNKTFNAVATLKKSHRDRMNKLDISEFSTRDPLEQGIKDINISLTSNPKRGFYSVTLMWGNYL
jgi:hypothetical protein